MVDMGDMEEYSWVLRMQKMRQLVLVLVMAALTKSQGLQRSVVVPLKTQLEAMNSEELHVRLEHLGYVGAHTRRISDRVFL